MVPLPLWAVPHSCYGSNASPSALQWPPITASLRAPSGTPSLLMLPGLCTPAQTPGIHVPGLLSFLPRTRLITQVLPILHLLGPHPSIPRGPSLLLSSIGLLPFLRCCCVSFCPCLHLEHRPQEQASDCPCIGAWGLRANLVIRPTHQDRFTVSVPLSGQLVPTLPGAQFCVSRVSSGPAYREFQTRKVPRDARGG